VAEPLLQHFGGHARFLVAVPLLLSAEPLAQSIARRIIAYFQSSGFLVEAERARFVEIVEDCRRLMRSRLALAVVVSIALLNAALATWQPAHVHELHWATSLEPGAGASASAPGGTSGCRARCTPCCCSTGSGVSPC
jgi:hypothetical protein